MLDICLVFWKSEPQYAYKRYAHKKHVDCQRCLLANVIIKLPNQCPLFVDLGSRKCDYEMIVNLGITQGGRSPKGVMISKWGIIPLNK